MEHNKIHFEDWKNRLFIQKNNLYIGKNDNKIYSNDRVLQIYKELFLQAINDL